MKTRKMRMVSQIMNVIIVAVEITLLNFVKMRKINSERKMRIRTIRRKKKNPRRRKLQMLLIIPMEELCVGKQSCKSSEYVWILDNGASNHMTSPRNLFENYEACVDYVHGADDSPMKVVGNGTVILKCVDECSGKNVRLENCYHIPSLATNLISMGTIDENGHKI